MIQQGLIEKVVVPSNRKKSLTASVKCFRLVQVDRIASSEDDPIMAFQHDDDEKDDDTSGMALPLPYIQSALTLLFRWSQCRQNESDHS